MPASRPVTKSARGAARTQYAKVPRKTTADDPSAYSKTPHAYGDILIRPDEKGRTKLGGALQRDLVYWIERETWGKNVGTAAKVERPEYAKLSLSQLAKLCGSDRRSVARSLADLAERGIIEARDREGCGPTVAKMYKLTPVKWKKAPWYKPPTLAEDDAADDEEEATEETASVEASAELEATVDPGKVSKPQPIAISPAKGAPVVNIRIVYRPVDFPFPVAFSSRPGRNGRLQVSCRATTLHRFAPSSPSETDVSVEVERVKSYSESIKSIVLDIWGKEADQRLIKSIVSASGTAPVWLFESLIEQRFPKRRNANNLTSGVLINIAGDAAAGQLAREKADAAAEARRQQQSSSRYSTMTAEELRELDERMEAEMRRPL